MAEQQISVNANALRTSHPWQPAPGEWHVGAGNAKFVFIPGLVKPINAGTPERGRRIVQCVNAHDGLVAALRAAEAALPDEKMLSVGNAMKQEEAGRIVRAALANLANATGTAANQTEGDSHHG